MDRKRVTQFIEHITSIFSPRCLVLSAAAVAATFFCMRAGLTADYPMALIGTAVIFPIVFSINSAYQRRELALGHYAKIKAHLRALFLGIRSWNGPLSEPRLAAMRRLISRPVFAIRGLITEPVEDLRENEKAVYRSFSDLTIAVERICRIKQLDSPRINAAHNHLETVMSEFEQLKHIYQYRTPRALQAFSDVFITVLPILYAPVFAALALAIDNWYLAFLVPALFAFVLSSLDNIQADLEDPFDGIGVDDIVINAEIFAQSLERGVDNIEAAAPQETPAHSAEAA